MKGLRVPGGGGVHINVIPQSRMPVQVNLSIMTSGHDTGQDAGLQLSMVTAEFSRGEDASLLHFKNISSTEVID